MFYHNIDHNKSQNKSIKCEPCHRQVQLSTETAHFSKLFIYDLSNFKTAFHIFSTWVIEEFYIND